MREEKAEIQRVLSQNLEPAMRPKRATFSCREYVEESIGKLFV